MNWWGRLLRRTEQESHLDRELHFHVEQRVADLTRGGLGEEEARRKVRLEFGGIDQVKEDCRDARGTRWIEDFGTGRPLRRASAREKPRFCRDCDRNIGVGNRHQHGGV